MKVAIHWPGGDRCAMAENSGDCPRSHRWFDDIRESKDLSFAKHLILLERRQHELENEIRTKSYAIARARYDEARVIASLLGYGVTEHAVWEQVRNAIQKQGTAEALWRGRLGASIDSGWWLSAATNLVEEWNK